VKHFVETNIPQFAQPLDPTLTQDWLEEKKKEEEAANEQPGETIDPENGQVKDADGDGRPDAPPIFF